MNKLVSFEYPSPDGLEIFDLEAFSISQASSGDITRQNSEIPAYSPGLKNLILA